MNRKKCFEYRKINFKGKKILFVFSFLLILNESDLFAQAQMNTVGEPKQDSSASIVIHQEISFKVSPQRLYQTLLSSGEFSMSTKRSFNNFSDTSARIDPVIGGTFSLFDGHIIGRILELVPNQRIVEAWRVVDWPPGIYSIVKFEIGSQKSYAFLVFDHYGFPAGLKEHLAIGWQQHYWDALNNYFK